MNQNDRLEYLVEAFKEDSAEYKAVSTVRQGQYVKKISMQRRSQRSSECFCPTT